MSRWLLGISAVASGLVAGVLSAVFFLTGAAPQAPAHAPPHGVLQAERTNCTAVNHSAIAAEVRRATREELSVFRESFRAAASEAPSDFATPGPDAAHAAAATRARAMLDDAIARRHWTDADADSLRDELADLPASQRAELVRVLSVAINQGRLLPESDRLPF